MTSETVFKALADSTRQRTLRILKGQELSVSDLVEILGQPQSTVSRHLRTLREAGLIRDRRDGTTVMYSLQMNGNHDAGADLGRNLLNWAGQQPLPTAVGHRLDAVIDRRREMSDRFFGRVGRHWDQLREECFGATFHLEAMISLLPSSWTVADIGTGTGYLLPVLARRFKRVIGLDPVDQMLDIARHNLAASDLQNVELREGGLGALPMHEGEIDLAIAMLVLHHVAAPAEALNGLAPTLRAGGRVLIVEQHAHDNESFREKMQDRWWGFEPDELAHWLRAAGFVDVETRELTNTDRPPETPGLFVATARKG